MERAVVTTADPGPKPAAPKHPVAVSVAHLLHLNNALNTTPGRGKSSTNSGKGV